MSIKFKTKLNNCVKVDQIQDIVYQIQVDYSKSRLNIDKLWKSDSFQQQVKLIDFKTDAKSGLQS